MHAAFQQLSRAYAARLSGSSCERCATHPDSISWSAQEVIEHLILTYRLSVAQCEKYRVRGQPTTRKAAWKQRTARLLVISLGYFPNGITAPEFVTPGRGGIAPMDGNALAAFFHEELGKLDQELALCEQAFGRQPIAAHFRFGPLTASQWRKFHMVHGRHHLAQLARINRRVQRPSRKEISPV